MLVGLLVHHCDIRHQSKYESSIQHYRPFWFLLCHHVVGLKYAMYDGNIPSWYFVNSYVTGFIWLIWRVREEKEVASVECRFHRSTAPESFEYDMNTERNR